MIPGNRYDKAHVYETKEVAEVCLNCKYAKPKCGSEGCEDYRQMCRIMSRPEYQRKNQTDRSIMNAFDIEFTIFEISYALSVTPQTVRRWRKECNGNYESMLAKHAAVFDRKGLKQLLKGAENNATIHDQYSES